MDAFAPTPRGCFAYLGEPPAERLALLERLHLSKLDLAHSPEEMERVMWGSPPPLGVVFFDGNPALVTALIKLLRRRGAQASCILVGDSLTQDQRRQLKQLSNHQQISVTQPRLEARLGDAIQRALHAKVRFDVRHESDVLGELVDDRGNTLPVRIVDLSESGARLSVPMKLSIGTELTLRIFWKDQAVSTQVVPMRHVEDQGNLYAGVMFEALYPDVVEVVQAIVAATQPTPPPQEPPRRAPRFSVPKALRIKARLTPSDGGRIVYAQVKDLSVHGFAAALPAGVGIGLVPVAKVKVRLLWPGNSLGALAELVRVESGARPQVAFHFLGVEREDHARLRHLVAELANRGQTEVAPARTKRLKDLGREASSR